ncbi:MAG: pre-peptidase C-terminal domain-containing protein [Tepidisphaeraceae bacterium]
MIDELEGRQLFAALTAGKTVSFSLNTTTAKQATYTVSLKSGTSFIVAAGDTGSTSFAPEVALINSAGTVVASSSGDKGVYFSKTVPATGTYTVRVRDVGQNQSGTVKLTAFYTGSTAVVDGDDAYTAQSGRRFAAGLEPGDLDVWKIDGKAGQFLSIVSAENSVGSAFDIGVNLIGPDGKIITTKASETGIKIDQASIKAGTYYAVAYESGANDTGRYGISFGQTPGVQYTGDPDTQSPLVSGQTRSGDLPGGDIDIFQLSLTAGKTINLTLARNGGTLDPEILIIDPTGKAVATSNGSTSTTLSYKTLTSGTYSILIRDREADDGGLYKLTYKLT